MTTLALIGYGRWGTNILRTLATLPDVQLKYVCAASKSELAAVPDRYQKTTDYTTLLAKDDIDGVLIATPGSTHAAIAEPFLAKGIATFIEKPLATTVADAARLQQAAASGAIGMVGHVHLYNPAYERAKELLPTLGTLRYLAFEGMDNGPYRDDMSALWDWAPHDVAMALDLLGSIPSSVQAWGIASLRPGTKLFDTATVQLSFPNTVTVLITVSWLAPEKRKKMTIVGTQSSLVLDDTATQKLTLYEHMGPKVDGSHVDRQEAKISHPSYSAMPPLQQELAAFVQAITTRTQPKSDLAQGAHVVKIIAAAEESIALGGHAVAC